MPNDTVKPGDVFWEVNERPSRWDPAGNLVRVLDCDEVVALCDRNPLAGRFRPRPRVPKEGLNPYSVAKLAVMRRFDPVPLSAAEARVYAPGLPMRLLRHPTLNWASFAGLDRSATLRKAAEAGWDLIAEPVVEAEEMEVFVVLFAATRAKAVRVSAERGGRIEAVELLVRLADTLAELGWEAPDGMGLHRMGTAAKGVPWYSLHGYYDPAGHLWRAESAERTGAHPEWWLRKGKTALRGDFGTRLAKLRRELPFRGWTEKRSEGLEQYTVANCRKVQRIFTNLIDRLVAEGAGTTVDAKLAAFAAAMGALNALAGDEPELIESGERDELAGWFDTIGEAAGLPADYLGEECERTVLAGREW